MADVVSFYNELSPIYERGILNLIRRQRSQVYVAVLKATFDPLDADVEKETVIASFSESIQLLAEAGFLESPKNSQDAYEQAHKLYNELSNRSERTNKNVYRFIEDRRDSRSGLWVSNLSQQAIRAISALEQMGKEESSLTGIKTNLILDLIAQARMAISPNVKARKAKLKAQIKGLQKELAEIENTGQVAVASPDEVCDQLQLIDDLIANSPAQLMLLTRTLKKLSADFQVMMADQSISADTALAAFQKAFANSFVNSNEGRRFTDVHRALYERNANTEMHDAFDDFKQSEVVKESGFDVDALTQAFLSLYERSSAVQRERLTAEKQVDSEICRAADMTYTTLRETLRKAFLTTSAAAKQNGTVELLWAKPRAQMRTSLDYVRAMPPKKTPAPKVNFNTQLPFNALDIEDVVRAAGPSATVVFSKILENSNGASVIDLASGFNNLEPKYRRECEVAGMLSALSKPKNVEGTSSFYCVGEGGQVRVWQTQKIECSAAALKCAVEAK